MSDIPGPILIIEDIPNIRDLLEVTLRYKGYKVFSAANGEEAIEKIKTILPSLIVTDVLMPRMDGFSLAQKLRTDPLTGKIPIIIISATYLAPEDKDFAQRLGIVRFIEKPIDTEDFLLTIAEVLTNERYVAVEPLTEKEFKKGYRERLENKLHYKTSQIARIERLLRILPEVQRGAFQNMLVEANIERDTLQAELNALYRLVKPPPSAAP